MRFFRAFLDGLRHPALPEETKRTYELAGRNDVDVFVPRISLHAPGRMVGTRMGAPIFVQAMWRAGSTYIWKKFRDQPRYRAYCEPLHEILSRPREQVRQANGPDVWKRLRHPVNDAFYFAEFPFSAEGGVDHFEKTFSFERYCLHETEQDEALRRYITHLIEYAESHGQTAMLQFNRGLLRAGWLSRQFHPVQVLLLRRPLNLWKSFLSYPGYAFATYISMIFGQNREKAPLRYLPSWLEFPRFVRPTVVEEWGCYQAFTAANAALLYPTFFDFSVLTSVHCAQFADCILDLDEITHNPDVRRAATERLRELGIEIDLTDCAAPSYEIEDSDREWLGYEEFSRQFLRGSLPEEISISRERMKAHEPLLGPYFRELLAGFTGRRSAEPANEAAAKSTTAVQLFAKHEFEPAARLLAEALADQPTSTRWNDWAVSQAACSRPRLAELGFGQSLRSQPTDREAAGNLGTLLLSQARTREALPLLERAELESDEATRGIVTSLVNKARQALGLSLPEQRERMLDLLDAQRTTLEQLSAGLAGLEQRVRELSDAVSRPGPAPAGKSETRSGNPKPPRPQPAAATTRTRRRALSAAAAAGTAGSRPPDHQNRRRPR